MNVGHLRWGGYALATLLAVATYFYGLDSPHIPRNGDEDVYAHIARLTAGSGHWLPLQSQLHEMRNTKPPLLFWQGMASTHFGLEWNWWQLRYPSVIYTLLTALLAYLLAKKLSGKIENGFIAALTFLAFFSTYRYGRPYLVNPGEVFWLFLPFFALLYWQAFESRLLPALLGIAVGIGLLYKSFALLLPVGLALTLWYLHHRRYRLGPFLRQDAWKLALIALLSLVLFGLWFLLDPEPQAIFREFIVGENVGKFDPHAGSYLSQLLWGGNSVWALALGYPLNAGLLAFPIAALFYIAYRQRAQLSADEKLLWIWVLVLLLVFSLPSQRSSRYLLDAMPALAVLIALYWQRIPRFFFMASLAASAAVLLLLTFLSLRLQQEVGGLYGAAYWLLLTVASACVLLGLWPKWSRTLLNVAVLLVYLVLAAFVRPFDGAAGNFSLAAQEQVRGKEVWVPCNFRAGDEGHRFLLPGANVHGYDESPELTPAELAKRYPLFAVQLPLPAAPCDGCQIVGQRLEIRGRQSDAEIKEMLRGRVYEFLFAKELLLASDHATAGIEAEGCR